MACVNTHSVTTRAAGAGRCCSTMPAGTPHVGMRWATTTRANKCMVCEIAASTSAKHPGRLIIKRGKSCEGGTCLCPTSVGGCCRLLAAA